jgi:hypothetical protein
VDVTRRLSWLSLAGIVSSFVLMVMVSVTYRSKTVPDMPRPTGWLPLEIYARLPDAVTTFGTWGSVVLAVVGVVAGLAAVARGARYPVWLMLGGGLAVVALFALLPPAGSTDTVSYAVYGRIAALGHNPYVMTPAKLARLGDPIGKVAVHLPYWHYRTSLYGPLATAEQWAAAELGGASVTGIIVWLKLWNAIMFAGITLGLDRLVRSDPARRTRVHLIWTVNPLVIWAVIAGGHLDVLAAGFGFLGLMTLRTRSGDGRVALPVALVSGLAVGISADIMLDYLLFAPALAWALRKQWPAFAAAAAGGLIALGPASVWAGETYFRGFASRGGFVGADSFYQLLGPQFRHVLPKPFELLVWLAFAGLALLLLWRLPDGPPDLPAIKPALALSLSWLFIFYYTLPWYDTMAIGLLAVYPASRLDWAVIGQFAIATFANLPGLVYSLRPHWVSYLAVLSSFRIMPLLLLAAVLALIWLAVSQRWEPGTSRQSRPAAPPTLSGAPARGRLVRWIAPAHASLARPDRQRAGKGGPGGAVRCGRRPSPLLLTA